MYLLTLWIAIYLHLHIWFAGIKIDRYKESAASFDNKMASLSSEVALEYHEY
jgi:hypothetical protein